MLPDNDDARTGAELPLDVDEEDETVKGSIVVVSPAATDVVRPAGEHPTKPGAVSLTEAHSAWLNKIAAIEGSGWDLILKDFQPTCLLRGVTLGGQTA